MQTVIAGRETTATERIAARRHLLDLDDWRPDELLAVMTRAEAMLRVCQRADKLETLRGQVLVNLFYENSTRTRVSFELAGRRLGADITNVTAAASSVAKGESLIDTAKTLQALGTGIFVIRSGQSGAADLLARHVSGTVINAGGGRHAHPSQPLLDLFTLRRPLGKLAGRRVVIVGVILHSRVARSNVWSLTAMGAQVVLCGPPTLLPAAAGAPYPPRPGPGAQTKPRVTLGSGSGRGLARAGAGVGVGVRRGGPPAGLLR